MDEIWNKETSFPDTKFYYGEPDNSKRIALRILYIVCKIYKVFV